MQRILIAGAFALAVGGPALAADLPPPVAPPPRAPAVYVPAAVPYYNWGGIYLGVNGGYGFGNSTWTGPAGGTTGSFTTNGFLAGGTVGANFQAGAFVFGVEGDLDWTNLSGSSAGGCGTLRGATIPLAVTCQTSQNYLGTARGRVGYAFDRVLLYATGGGAYGNIKAQANGTAVGFGSNSNGEFGWTAGAGLEFAFAQNWTAKAEYLYVSLANGSCTTACTIPAGATPANVPVSLKENLVRAGLNYKFSF